MSSFPKHRKASWWIVGKRLATATLCGLLPTNGGALPLAADEADVDSKAEVAFFTENVLPILKANCYECHSHDAGEASGGLMLDSRGGWEKGGDSGPAVAPGMPEESLLIQAVRYGNPDLEMPPTGKLSDAAVALLEQWVTRGAHDPRDADAAASGGDREERRGHWAFQPVRPTRLPEVKDKSWPRVEADYFLLARLEQEGLQPAPDADRHTWLRRVSFDLTGLPPTPEETAEFVADTSPQAYEGVVDRLLASPAFGERWARHWLDLVGYADQIGTANDVFAEHAWRYRNYVIDAFNHDKPFDRFICEQVAGDLLPHDSVEERAANLTAIGFLVLGDIAIVEADKAKLRVDVVDQQVDKVGKAFLGMTLGCARCHDHKFDPIPQRDYYAMAGFFYNAESVYKTARGVWSDVIAVELPETEQQQADRSAQVQRHNARLTALRNEKALAEQRKVEIEAALNDAATGHTDETKKSLRSEQDQLAGRINQLNQQIEHAEFFAPATPKAFGVRDNSAPDDMRITIRGNPHALGDAVPRGFLQAATLAPPPTISDCESGRRELAAWIASPENPLTARVAVNRIWQKLFGAGLVRSVDYFGVRGEAPSHPELLDALAIRFVREGWSQKRLIRTLALSRTYRMSSAHAPRSHQVDPENRLLWRMNRWRLDAEAVRDSLLAVSGKLAPARVGPALPLEYPENVGNLAATNVNPPSFHLRRFRPEQAFQRTVYLPVIRSGPQPGPAELRNVFDFTQPAEMSGQRATTAVPTQALFLMNAPLFKERARDLAARLVGDESDESARLDRLWLLALNRPVTAEERVAALAFLSDVRDNLSREQRDDAAMTAWIELCHAVLASNEFLMRL